MRHRFREIPTLLSQQPTEVLFWEATRRSSRPTRTDANVIFTDLSCFTWFSTCVLFPYLTDLLSTHLCFPIRLFLIAGRKHKAGNTEGDGFLAVLSPAETCVEHLEYLFLFIRLYCPFFFFFPGFSRQGFSV